MGLVAAGMVAAGVAATPAIAAPKPPEVTFVTRSESDPAFLRTYCWGEYDPPFTYHECLEGDIAVPPGRRMRGLDSVHVTIHHPQEPDALKLLYWEGTDWRRPKDARQLQAATRPVMDSSGVGWVVDFELSRKWKHLSLEIRVSWETEFTCPTCGRQWGEWRVTLRS